MERTASSRWSAAVRVVIFAVGTGLLLFSALEMSLLYSGQTPFRQMYSEATPAQQATATRRLVAALLGAPVGFGTAVAALRGERVLRRPRASLRALAALLLLTSLQSCTTLLFLPYGFGSGYEHASAAQRGHLRLAGGVCAISSLLAVAAFMLSAWAPRQASAPAGLRGKPEDPNAGMTRV